MDKYLSAKDGITIIIFLFFISFLWATSIPAAKAAPEEIPIGNPSIFAAILAVANAVSFAIWIISSMQFLFKILGIKPAPIPWILCGPAEPPESTGLSSGSTAIIFIFLFFFF